VVQDAVNAPRVRLAVGVSDSLAKLVVHRLLKPVLATSELQLRCDEGGLDTLLAALALHRLDLVLADRPAPPNPSLRLYSHALGATPIVWYAQPALAVAARRGFPHSLAGLPLVLPSPHVAVRQRLERWFEALGLRPHVAGEFDDSALLKTFGAAGMGIFPAAEIVQDEIVARYGVERVGRCGHVEEHFFAIGTERKVQHPLVLRLLADPTAPRPPLADATPGPN
jgi:LysR family transcriptional activator of nhaA